MSDKSNSTSGSGGVDTHVPSKSERESMSQDKDYKPGTTGAVLDPSDGRLKENRDKGVTLGTTAHSATGKVQDRQADEPAKS